VTTNPDFESANPDFETDATGQTNPLDPDPAAPGPSAEAADTVGVPAGSADPIGGSDSIDGREVSDTADDDAIETPIMPSGAGGDEANT
jgi:hypothetical protein